MMPCVGRSEEDVATWQMQGLLLPVHPAQLLRSSSHHWAGKIDIYHEADSLNSLLAVRTAQAA